MPNKPTDKSDIIQSVSIALQVLETLASANGDMGVTELAIALDTTKSRIHRHLRSLLLLGYIIQSEQTEKYRIGARLISLGQAASTSADLTSVAQKHMGVLSDKTGHAVSLGLIDNDGIRILNTLHSKMQIEIGVRPGSLLGYCNSAQGKIALASMVKSRALSLIPRTIIASTEYTITDKDEFIAHIEEIKENGWATAPNETMLGLNALACAVFNATGEPVATIALVSLTHHIETPPHPEQIKEVRAAAAQISADLGYVAE